MDAFLNVAVSNSVLAGALALAALIAHRVGRRPQVAHALWLLVLIKLITPPLVSVELPVAPTSVAATTNTREPTDGGEVVQLTADEPSSPAIPAGPSPVDVSVEAIDSDVVVSSPRQQSMRRSEVTSLFAFLQTISWQGWFCILWAGGVVAGAAMLWRQLRRFRRLLLHAVDADQRLMEDVRGFANQLGIRSVPAVRTLDAQVPPLVYAGTGGLTLLLPIRLLRELDQRQIHTVIVHELAHIRRRDHWTRWFDGILRIVLWWHPLVWFAGSQLRRAEEECCDAWVLWALPDEQRAYGNALLWTVEFLDKRQPGLPAAGTAFGGSHVKNRIETIMRTKLQRQMSVGAILALIVVAAGVLPVAGQQPQQVQPRSESSASVDPPATQEKPSSPEAESSGPKVHVASGESIQAAIDAAADGTTIVLAEGTFAERLKIWKPLTIEGVGWDKTTLQPQDGIKDSSEATVEINRAKSVVVRGIKITVSAADAQASTKAVAGGSLPHTTAVRLVESDVAFSDVVVVGPCGLGIDVTGGSKLDISGSLVAAVWGTGIAVLRRRDDSGNSNTLTMRECVVRNCYHRGINLGAGSNDSVIERSWISGSAWHGIRYDDAFPRIERNFIFGNARFGIYASGLTAATVRRNLFTKNEMAGMSCWFANADTIEANLFYANEREALAVLGAGSPRVTRNLFEGEKVAVRYGKISRDGVEPQGSAEPRLEANVFRGVEMLVEVDGEPGTIPLGNTHIGSGIDFARPLSEFGPLDTDAAAATYQEPGGLESLCINPKWPQPLPEEVAIIPTGATRDYRAWNKGAPPAESVASEQASKKADDAIQPWIDDAFQIDDVAKREAAVEKIRAALNSSADDEQYLGAKAFTAIAAVRFDKASFHDLLVPLLQAENPMLRLQAAQSLVISGVQEGDLERLVALANDTNSEIRKNISSLIVSAAKGDLTSGPAADSLLKLLNDSLADVRRSAIQSLGNGTFSPQIEAKVIELSRQHQQAPYGEGYDTLYYALSTQRNKSEASVKRLIEFLSDKDTLNVAGRAAWGLQVGIAKEQHPLVAETALKVVTARSDGYLFEEAMTLLKQYAGSGQVAAIRTLLEKPGVDGELRTGLEEALKLAQSR